MDAELSPVGHPIVGSWRTADSGHLDVPVFPLLNTFTSDGVVLSALSSVSPLQPRDARRPGLLSAAHGSWIPTGDRTAASTHVALRADEGGTHLGTVTIRATAHVDADGQALEVTFTGEIAEVDGTVVRSFPGTFEATRIGVAPIGSAP